MTTINAEFPEKLDFLFRPMRYKVAYGGRSATKSWGFARALLILGRAKKLRILCTREIQKSIKDSVHRLLKDQIQLLGLGKLYEVLDQEIKGTNGTEFLFSGLSTHTVESIKSFEGIDIVWVEEAQVVRKRSWDILIPTIRKNNSEIWVSFNPDLETDDTYQRFVVHPPPECISIPVNYNDNPWFNDLMEKERLHSKATDPDNYENIWEGKCRPAVEGAIFFKEVQLAQKEGRVCNVPYDPMLKVHIVSDLGNLDAMFCAFVQKHASEVRVIRAIQGGCRSLPEYSAVFKEFKYNWGRWWLPHDGYAVSRQTGKSDAQILGALGWDVPVRDEITEKSVEAGIREARMIAHQVYIDKKHADPLVESLKRYRRRVNQQTESESTPLPNKWAHGGDCYRYIALNFPNMRNEDEKPKEYDAPSYEPLDAVIGY